MQTFLPYSDFNKSAKSLDKKRCWCQVKEAKQLIGLLTHRNNNEFYRLDIVKIEKKGLTEKFKDAPKYSKERKDYYRMIPWINHSAVLMWEGHLPELKVYYNCFLAECRTKHKINTQMPFYIQPSDFSPRVQIYDDILLIPPWWVGNEDFHRAMRARLIEKDRDFYLPLFPEDEGFNGGKYWWPDMKTQTFKII